MVNRGMVAEGTQWEGMAAWGTVAALLGEHYMSIRDILQGRSVDTMLEDMMQGKPPQEGKEKMELLRKLLPPD